MKKYFEPQILFIYNKYGRIKETIFVTYDEENLLESNQYKLFTFLIKNNINLFENKDYTVLHNHILLTLNLAEIRGYIREILKTDLKILVFSFWNNVDYSYSDDSYFNPFSIDNKVYKKNLDTTIIYEIYPRIFSTTIFCIIDENNIKNEYKNLCSEGIYNNEIQIFMDKIINPGIDEDFELEITNTDNYKSMYNINWSENLIYDIKNMNQYQKIFNDYYYDNIFISGDKLCLVNNSDITSTNQSNKNDNNLHFCWIYKNNIEKDQILHIYNEMLYINKTPEYDDLLSRYPKFYDYIIKKKNIKQNIKIDYNIVITSNINIDFETDFFIETTKKTKNIFLDRTKKINIMTSTNHIYFSSYSLNIQLFKYITKVLIGLQISKGQVDFIKQDKKMGSRYYSRYCQGIRKPKILNEEWDKDHYKNYNDMYFENIYDQGDIFFDTEKQKYIICDVPDLTNIGFINEIYKGYNICLPCCYKKNKKKNEVFQACITNPTTNDIISEKDSNTDIILNPYINIFKQYRVIIDKNKIGLLVDKLNNFFNENITILYQDKTQIKKINIDTFLESPAIKAKTNEDKNMLKNIFILKKKYNIQKIVNTNIFINQQTNQHTYLYEDCNFESYSKDNYSFLHNHIENKNKLENFKIQFTNLKPIQKIIYENNHQKNEELNFPITNKNSSEDLKKFYKYFETMENFLLMNHQNRLQLANNYIIYVTNPEELDFSSLENIKFDDRAIIYFINNSIYFNPNIIINYQKDKKLFLKQLKFYLIIQNKIHILKMINKKTINSNIEISDINYEYKEKFIEKIFKTNQFNINLKFENIHYTEDYYQIDKKKIYYIDQKPTKFFYSIDKISLTQNNLGSYIINILYKKYFSIVYDSNPLTIENFKKVFLVNLKNLLNEDINFNKFFDLKKDYRLLPKIISLLNPQYINTKELLKIESLKNGNK